MTIVSIFSVPCATLHTIAKLLTQRWVLTLMANSVDDESWLQICALYIQEAQLPQRNSASAAHMEGGWG